MSQEFIIFIAVILSTGIALVVHHYLRSTIDYDSQNAFYAKDEIEAIKREE